VETQIAAQLLDGIEQYFRRTGVTRLRINSLAVNTSAQTSYERAGFVPYEVLYEKVIAKATSRIVSVVVRKRRTEPTT
jgi:GNAT superfamily N-acetyltransferase